ncbi:MAG: Fic family protein [bacterium]|nr:Fic family protein [bacterium]
MESILSISPRAGYLLRRPAGHTTFEPATLPPEGLHLNGALHRVLSAADHKLGFLLGQAAARPQSASWVAMACRREAVASCRLEGSTVTLGDLLWFELDGVRADTLSSPPGELRVCLNYAAILLKDTEDVAAATPVLRASLCALHQRLYRGVRGRDERSGHVRKAEIWLGPRGSTLQTAHYVPPAPEHIAEHLARLVAFAEDDGALPPLARLALIICQLESIHPFVDGNGRVTRLTLLRLLSHVHGPAARLLCPSVLSAQDVGGHFRRLQQIRHAGDWEGWIHYFGCLVRDAATAAADVLTTADDVLREHIDRIRHEQPTIRETGTLLLRHLASQPLVSVQHVAEACGRTFANANLLVRRLEALGLLTEITGRQRHRRYVYSPFIDMLQRKS